MRGIAENAHGTKTQGIAEKMHTDEKIAETMGQKERRCLKWERKPQTGEKPLRR